ncbi:MAG: HDIG domain-containing metalloprotein [Bacteroidaceae bacterium]
MIIPEEIIHRYCIGNIQLEQLLLQHSKDVARKALQVAAHHPELNLDCAFLEEAALLHDIGIVSVNAPNIFCHGTKPYICHGLAGAEILRKEGLPLHARVAERHTCTGITRKAIEQQNLPLPLGDYLPETIEEQVICYADKFFSKSHPEHEKTLEEATRSLWKFGPECAEKMMRWNSMFG